MGEGLKTISVMKKIHNVKERVGEGLKTFSVMKKIYAVKYVSLSVQRVLYERMVLQLWSRERKFMYEEGGQIHTL